jgi:protein-L-isoaspartate O-methyltransferase
MPHHFTDTPKSMRKDHALIREPRTSFKYHQFRARLGMGDLHPGGPPATGTILRWLQEHNVRRVLEVGAGIGNTAGRMTALGWDVTAIEPDPVLFAKLRKRLGKSARCEQFLAHRPAKPYDAIVAESVFFQMNLPQVFTHAAVLLKPGGYLAFVEAVWTDRITAAMSSELHDMTQRLFGIPVGSREPLTWRDWSSLLSDSGFETINAELLPRGSAGHPPSANWPASLAAMICDPRLALWMVRYRLRKRLAGMPSGVQESRIFLGKTSAKPAEGPC